MISPEKAIQKSEDEVARLFQFYSEAEAEILEEINTALLRGNDTSYLQTMLSNVQDILNDLLAGSKTWCEEAVQDTYLNGVAAADAQLAAMGVSTAVGFGEVHQQAAQVLAESAYNRFDDVATTIGRRVDDIYRTLALENIKGSVVGYKTWQQVAQNFREQLATQGVTGFEDKLKRKWNMRTYAEMVARTTTMEAHLQGTAIRLMENGHDLVKVSSHAGACEKCVPWQGKILSLSGQTEGYPTLQEAKDKGLFHPRCRHAYGLYLPDLEDNQNTGQPKVYPLSNYEQADIPEKKITKYALNKNHRGTGKDKAVAFEQALGYNLSNYEDLIEAIKANLPQSNAVVKGQDSYGTRYEVKMTLTGPNGKSAPVTTGWIIDKGSNKPRLVTVFVDKR
jgi:Phage minor capsid protein 2.